MDSQRISSLKDKVHKMLETVNTFRPRIFRISQAVLVLPIFFLALIPLLSPLALRLPNADVVEFQFRYVSATIDIGYYSMCLTQSDRRGHAAHGCLATNDRHVTGKDLARRWAETSPNPATPDIYQRLGENLQMALDIQREAFYPGLLIAAVVVWVASVVMFVVFSARKNKNNYVALGVKSTAVVGLILMLGATLATQAGSYAVMRYVTSPSGHWDVDSGRIGAIMAVQWAGAFAMTMYTLLTFDVVGRIEKEEGLGSIRLEED